jgi:hypothetical protein
LVPDFASGGDTAVQAQKWDEVSNTILDAALTHHLSIPTELDAWAEE